MVEQFALLLEGEVAVGYDVGSVLDLILGVPQGQLAVTDGAAGDRGEAGVQPEEAGADG
jgi:hypothetical protein